MITLKNTAISVGKKTILTGLNFTIHDKGLTTILGPNGSGKSTLIKALSKINQISAGDLLIKGKDVRSYSVKELAEIVAYLPQNTKGFKQTTVSELLTCAKYQNKGLFDQLTKKDFKEIEDLLLQFNIDHLKHRYISSLSGGEKQRVYLSFALCQNPQILLLDEPTTYLDIAYQKELLEMVWSLKKDMAIVMVLHDINQAIRYSDHIIVLKEGTLFKEGLPSIMTEDLIQQVYHIKTKYLKEENIFVF